ncbi:hypothetical protein GLOIN_2v1886063 [Rhizophagus irregularis DAOM 181602=DAOM 197198]|uniref:Uncharacterized protein n=1 Tax=Rhizophagus irregularis (strain DAOM 181602 / DAOM 197198 / MUCL 43194) TaxID=747089 RepID=A0A2P4NYG3_RHIID|nr:hypothetical protein GLOIN_2v1886063 [Rhizophagus irregularis DAOM 181602=DAOM 197198]POG58128.1 hypothetical protein GLOIN_2v1886063 [Rhizophagus irregularis DAOM 181602=DAOM 197198]|eukprot:XP_025164994.1 hypothetical protein GLOIN_2v1886063 [Rhizophagus irregularis DAOM 181602=DAOM 197198]
MACETELPDLPETEQFKKPGRKKNDVWNYFIKEEARKFDHSPNSDVFINEIENDNDPFENLVSDDEEENKQKMIQI